MISDNTLMSNIYSVLSWYVVIIAKIPSIKKND